MCGAVPVLVLRLSVPDNFALSVPLVTHFPESILPPHLLPKRTGKGMENVHKAEI